MNYRILVVDENIAFSTMLTQCLGEMGNVKTEVVTSGKEALRSTAANDYDLAIVDMGLPDVEAPLLVRSLRQEHPALRLMIIPLIGDEAPAELKNLDLQGVLSKPFFLPELPDLIRAALARSVGGQPPPPTATKEQPAATPAAAPAASNAKGDPDHAMRLMARLAQEVGAEAVLLVRDGALVSQAGRIQKQQADGLAAAVNESWQASARIAKSMGKEPRFEQSIEGTDYLLYTLTLAENLILSVIVQGKVPLGMIRHQAKEAAEKIRGLMGA